MKYIIKNCPAYDEFLQEPNCNINSCDCKDVNNCLLKQIVEECKDAIKTYDKEEFYEDDCDSFLGESIMAQQILDLLEIEKIEE